MGSTLGGGALDAPQRQEWEEIEDTLQGSCTLTPSDVEGPFWLDLNLIRQDITEGFAGFPMSIYIKLVEAATCDPIAGGVVDIWHDDPEGRYSGFPSEGTAGQTFLRGIQITGQDGVVRFDTIYPGWYTGRTPHIHLKINPNAGQELTTQLYFEDKISERIYTNFQPYVARGVNPVDNDSDAFFQPELLVGSRQRTGSLVVGKKIAIT